MIDRNNILWSLKLFEFVDFCHPSRLTADLGETLSSLMLQEKGSPFKP